MEPSTGPQANKLYVGPVENLSGPVTFCITSIQIMGFGSRLWDLGAVRSTSMLVVYEVIISTNLFETECGGQMLNCGIPKEN